MAEALQRAVPDAHDLSVLLRDAIEALSEAFALFDADGRLVLCNTRFRETNAALDDLIRAGIRWDILLHEAEARGVVTPDAARRLQLIEARLEPGEPPETFEFETPAGRFAAATLSCTEQGGIVLTLRDVTARRKLREREREADEVLRRVLEACPANVVMSRVEDGEIIYRSPAATELLGPAHSTVAYFADRLERADFLTELLPNGRVSDMRITCLRPDGTPFPCTISARIIDYRGADVIVSTVEDRTEQVAMERELAAQRETIFQAEKMSALGELLAGVAHELNNPLSVVVGHALMLREEVTDPEAVRRIEKIGQAAERCTRIVKSFLAMARQQPAALAPADLPGIVASAVDAFDQGPGGGRIAIRRDLPPRLPPLLADAEQIAQVLINLLTNADQAIAEAGRGGRVEVTARHDAAAGMIELRVRDDGPGVPPTIRGRIFDPLFTTKDVGQGTGIGLAFCHRVVTSHGGQIRLDPDAGPGATFVLRLPVAHSVATTAPPPGATARPGRARILVVDDEPDVAELIREILTRDGFDVDHAGTAEEALARIAADAYALILSDLNMPGLGGRGFHEALVRDHPGLGDRLGFVTGDTMSPAARGFLDAAGCPFLEKPIAPAELRGLVRRMLAGPAEDGAP